jgi:hypothetical protein
LYSSVGPSEQAALPLCLDHTTRHQSNIKNPPFHQQ